MELTSLEVSAASWLFWFSLRFALRRYFSERKAVAAHTVSFLHSVASVLGILALKHEDGACLRMDFYRRSSRAEEHLMAMSLGYFLYDIRFTNKTWLETVMTVHHFGSCLGFAEILRSGRGGGAVLMVTLVMEGSNPLLHLRRILHSSGLDDNYFYTYLEYAYVLLFVYLRFVLGGSITIGIINGEIKCEPIHFYIMIFFNVLSLAFLCAIFHYVLKKYTNLFTSYISADEKILEVTHTYGQGNVPPNKA